MSPDTFPEISFVDFTRTILEQQHTPALKKKLIRGQIELCFIRATRGDDAHGVGGTLCRGEFMEVLLRCCQSSNPRQLVSDNLDEFLFIYLKPQYDMSEIYPVRKEIRKSKKLNQFLHDNKDGLVMIYEGLKQPNKGFTLKSAVNVLKPLQEEKSNKPAIANYQILFVYS